MNSSFIQLIVLAAIAVFLILRLKNTLGTREGFEEKLHVKDTAPPPSADIDQPQDGYDYDIADHSNGNKDLENMLTQMKSADPAFNVSEFIGGAKSAYELILMAFEKGDISQIAPFLADNVQDAFQGVIDARNEKGLKVDATFMGVSNVGLKDAFFDPLTKEAQLTMRFTGELVYQVRDSSGTVIEGDDAHIKKQNDVWTFGRNMQDENPNWKLVETGA